MGVGAGGGHPLPQGRGGFGTTPEKILKNKDLIIYAIFKIKFLINIIVISYLVELFIFE